MILESEIEMKYKLHNNSNFVDQDKARCRPKMYFLVNKRYVLLICTQIVIMQLTETKVRILTPSILKDVLQMFLYLEAFESNTTSEPNRTCVTSKLTKS